MVISVAHRQCSWLYSCGFWRLTGPYVTDSDARVSDLIVRGVICIKTMRRVDLGGKNWAYHFGLL